MRAPAAGPRGPFCATGRETGPAEVVWRDGWLWLKDGGQLPPTTIDPPATRQAPGRIEREFTGPDLPPEFQWLRTPYPERLFTMTGDCLRLTGRESLGSWFEQALVVRRQEEPAYRAEVDFLSDPMTWQQAAGLITYYNRHKFHAALIAGEEGERMVTLVSCLGDWPGETLTYHGRFPVVGKKVTLAARVDRANQQFFVNGAVTGPVPDASIVSDEGGRGEHASFTGAFVGVVAHDLTGQGWTADVTRFLYDEGI